SDPCAALSASAAADDRGGAHRSELRHFSPPAARGCPPRLCHVSRQRRRMHQGGSQARQRLASLGAWRSRGHGRRATVGSALGCGPCFNESHTAWMIWGARRDPSILEAEARATLVVDPVRRALLE